MDDRVNHEKATGDFYCIAVIYQIKVTLLNVVLRERRKIGTHELALPLRFQKDLLV